jgi:hypothetical protein
MPNERAIATVYTVTSCALVSDGGEVVAGNLLATLDGLRSWTSHLNIRETATFEPLEDAKDGRVYVAGIAHSADNDTTLIATWNEVESADGAVLSIAGDEPVGTVHVDAIAVPKGNIPGYPSYFWFLPGEQVCVNVRFPEIQRLNGHQGLKQYIDGYLAYFSPWVRSTIDANGGRIILGYAPDEDSEPVSAVARYVSRLNRKAGKIDYLRQNVSSIRKVIRKAEYDESEAADRTWLRRLAQKFLWLPDVGTGRGTVSVKSEIEARLDADELDSLIDSWSTHFGQAGPLQTSWDDVGFVLAKDQTIHWLSHAIPRGELTLAVDRKVDGSVNLDALLVELTQRKTTILAFGE